MTVESSNVMIHTDFNVGDLSALAIPANDC